MSTTSENGYTIIRTESPPKPPKHEHGFPPMGSVDYGAVVRCECGAVFTLKRIGAFPAWHRTWWFYPEHPDFAGLAWGAVGAVIGIFWGYWTLWGQY